MFRFSWLLGTLLKRCYVIAAESDAANGGLAAASGRRSTVARMHNLCWAKCEGVGGCDAETHTN